jgi:hypothetical protein
MQFAMAAGKQAAAAVAHCMQPDAPGSGWQIKPLVLVPTKVNVSSCAAWATSTHCALTLGALPGLHRLGGMGR